MVLLPLNKSPDGWELIRGSPVPPHLTNIAPSDAATRTGPVLIFTSAADPDAVAAARTLTALLKADLVRYELHPVAGYTELRAKFNKLARGETSVDPRAVLCINCGALVDLETILGLNSLEHDPDSQGEVSDVRVFVMDSHRPFHLKNVNSARVVVFDDDDAIDDAAIPLDINCEDEWGNVPDDASSDESEPESDDDLFSDQSDGISDQEEDVELDESQTQKPSSGGSEPDEDSDPVPQPRKRARRVTDVSDDESERNAYFDEVENDDVVFDDNVPATGEESSDEDEQVVRKGHTRRAVEARAKRIRAGRKRKKRANKRARRSRARNDPEIQERRRIRSYYSDVKLASSSACVSHFVAQRMKRSNIDTVWMAILGATSQYVLASTSFDDYHRALSLCRDEIESVNQRSNEDDPNTSSVQNVGYVPTCSTVGAHRIAASVELRLDLLRHWSLHDSLLFSSYTATRLAAWRQTGKRRLLEFLATLGIPLKQSQQKWCYMKQENKIALEDQLSHAIRRFDLGESFQYDSYVRSMPGHRGEISAGDFVYAISALLEFSDASQSDSRTYGTDSQTDRFWCAYDALDSRKPDILHEGLEMAISAQRITAEIGGDVIERRKFVPSGPFRYVFLRDQQLKEFITHPLLLRRLALFLKAALVRQGARDKPFIILAPDIARKKWIAVAAATNGQKNDFGHRFRQAAERNGSEVTFDGFESSVCEIEDGQEIEFVRFLHDVMR